MECRQTRGPSDARSGWERDCVCVCVCGGREGIFRGILLISFRPSPASRLGSRGEVQKGVLLRGRLGGSAPRDGRGPCQTSARLRRNPLAGPLGLASARAPQRRLDIQHLHIDPCQKEAKGRRGWGCSRAPSGPHSAVGKHSIRRARTQAHISSPPPPPRKRISKPVEERKGRGSGHGIGRRMRARQ